MIEVMSGVGRLVLVRFKEFDPGDAEVISRAASRLGGRALMVADLRAMRLLGPAQAALVEGSPVPTMAREAFLVGPSVIQAMQAARITKAAAFESRRIFDEPQSLMSWMGEVATVPELARLRTFVAAM